MPYSLLNRFQGTLLGAAIGASIAGPLAHEKPHPPASSANPVQNGTSDAQVNPTQVAIASIRAWIESGGVPDRQWVSTISRLSPPDPSTFSAAEAMAILPVLLFCHESPSLLRNTLYHILDLLSTPPEIKEGLFALGYAIAQALRNSLQPTLFIPQLLDILETSETRFAEQLQRVQGLVAEGAGLETARDRLAIAPLASPLPESSPIALAFYSFLSTPEQFQLAVMRATQGSQPPLCALLTAALSGAYNSIQGIPLAWRLAAGQSGKEMLKSSDRLLAAWSGVYDLDRSPPPFWQLPAVGAPNVIRPRE